MTIIIKIMLMIEDKNAIYLYVEKKYFFIIPQKNRLNIKYIVTMSFSSWFSKAQEDDSKTDKLEKLFQEIQAMRTTFESDRDGLQEKVDLLEEQLESYKTRVSLLESTLKDLEKNQTYLYYDGSIYQGETKDGKQHGFGTIHYSNGYRYVGEWQDGLFHGKGTLYRDWVSPPFHGEWKQHLPHGKGSYDGFIFDTYEYGMKV